MKKNKNTNNYYYLIGGLLLIIAIAIFQGGTFSVFSTTDNRCVFADGGVCEYTGTLEAGKQFSTYRNTLSFDKSISNDMIDTTAITDLIDERTYSVDLYDAWRFGYYNLNHDFKIYRLPDKYLENGIYEAEIQYVSNVDLSGGREVLVSGYFKEDYNDNQVVFCFSPNTICPTTTLAYLYENGGEFGERVSSTTLGTGRDLIYFSTITSRTSTTIRNILTQTPITRVFSDTLTSDNPNYQDTNRVRLDRVENLEDMAFVYVSRSRPQLGNSSEMDYTSNEAFYISYRPYLYPKNVVYGTRNFEGGMLFGEQKEVVTTLDYAGIVNKECGRPENNDTCDFTITFKSDTTGVIELLNTTFEVEDIPLVPDQGDVVGDNSNGNILFDQDGNLKTTNLLLLVLGFLIIIGAVLFIGNRKKWQ